jgi:lipopolysaccharide transport system ATP-binding protein
MREAIITVENLGKRYALRHLRDQRYVALRDVLVEKATGLFRRDRRNGQHNGTVRPENLKEDFWALRGVSFEVEQGEVVGIIGRNGAGKSTLLKVLSRITAATEGRAHIKGRVASLLEVGTGFHPELTGRENIFLNGAILGMHRGEIKKKFDEIVAFAEIERFLDTPVKRYSSGMYVRLAFAVAAHLEPEVLIIDEVLAVGDAAFQRKCLGKIREVTRGGRTVLFVSHNMTSILGLCSTGLLLNSGEVEAIGPIRAVVETYLAGFGTETALQRTPIGAKLCISRIAIERVSCRESTMVSLMVDITSRTEQRCSLELKLHDQYGGAIGLASVGLLDSSVRIAIREGKQSFRCELEMPRLAQGTYSIDAQIADPMVEVLDSLPRAVAFEVIPHPAAATVRPLEAAWGYGAIEIPLRVAEAK